MAVKNIMIVGVGGQELFLQAVSSVVLRQQQVMM